ncbi:MAG: AzlC family ABC transporter permease [Bacillota bacterium]
MIDARKHFLRGVSDIAPILLGVMPFGMISGIAAVNAGLSEGTAMLFSVFLFAGASQLAAYQLIGAGAAAFVIIYTTLVINMRFLVYSASIAPFFRPLSTPRKWLYAYMLTDQGYALSVLRLRNHDIIDPQWYYLGVSLPIWITWQVFSLAGIYLGSAIPEQWGLDFAIPLTFLAVLVGALESSETVIAAVTGGLVAVAAHNLPLNLGLVAGILAGILAGMTAAFLRGTLPARRGEH